MAWSADGRLLACGDAAGSIRLWEVAASAASSSAALAAAPAPAARITVGSLAADPALVWSLAFLPYEQPASAFIFLLSCFV